MAAVDLAYDDAGEGPVVVLIHGHPFNRSMWAPQLGALSRNFRVIAPDLRGYGDSPVTDLERPGDFNEHLLGFLDRTRAEVGQ
jgi:3-oxoadipate enol-lactonase